MNAAARRVARRAAVLALVVVGLLSGCTPTPGPATPTRATAASQDGTGEVRHDLPPLVNRFPQLQGAESATWLSGTVGEGRVPGPTTYWIDAVVVLDASSYTALRAKADDSAETADLPDLDPGLDTSLPPGPFARADALDADFSAAERSTTVFLDDSTRSVVLSSRFE